MRICTRPVGWLCVLQYDIYRSVGLAIRDDQVESEARFPWRLPASLELIKSSNVFQIARLDHSQPAANPHFSEMELHSLQRFWINDRFYLFHKYTVTRRKRSVLA